MVRIVNAADVPLARMRIDARGTRYLDVHGFTADHFGVPAVALDGDLSGIETLTVDQATYLGNALLLAACVARGDAAAPSALEDFIARRKP